MKHMMVCIKDFLILPQESLNIYVFVYIKTLAFGSHFFDACFSGIPLASNPSHFCVRDILMSIIA